MLLSLPPSLALAALFTIRPVSAHGWINSISVNGKQWPGADPSWHLLGKSPSAVWYSDNYGQQNPLFSSQASTNDVACHINATSGSLIVPVNAGDTLELTWQTPEGGPWRISHEGPVIDYMASCNGDCRDASASKMKFFKIAESGMFMSPHKTADGNATFGLWGTDILRNAGNKWSVVIPPSLSGQYVLRSELIALMAAGNEGHAQMFPQCINLDISPSTSSGHGPDPCVRGAECRLGRDLYTETQPGIAISIHSEIDHYPFPGPAVWQGASTSADANPMPKNLAPLPMPEAGRNSGNGSDSGDNGAQAHGSATPADTSLGVRLSWNSLAVWSVTCLSNWVLFQV